MTTPAPEPTAAAIVLAEIGPTDRPCTVQVHDTYPGSEWRLALVSHTDGSPFARYTHGGWVECQRAAVPAWMLRNVRLAEMAPAWEWVEMMQTNVQDLQEA